MERERTNEEWLRDLRADGVQHAAAVRDLQTHLQRAVFLYYRRHPGDVSDLPAQTLTRMANGAVEAALDKIVAQAGTFHGQGKFTTWAFSVAIGQAAHWLSSRGATPAGETSAPTSPNHDT